MKTMLLLFLVMVFNASAQNHFGEYTSWEKITWGTTLNFRGNNIFHLASRTPNGGGIRLSGKYRVHGDTVILSKKRPSKASVSYRWQNYGPQINLNVIDQYSKSKINGYQKVSYDGITEENESNGDHGYVSVNKMLSDSLRLNGEWIKIDRSNQSVNRRLRITTITQELNRSKITDNNVPNYPMYFDSLLFVFDGTSYTHLPTPEFADCDMTMFNGMRKKTWSTYIQQIGVVDTIDHSFIHNDSIQGLTVTREQTGLLDVSRYTNLKTLKVHKASSKLKINSSHLDKLTLTVFEGRSISLKMNQEDLNEYWGVPIAKSNLKSINHFTTYLFTESDWETLNTCPLQIKRMTIFNRLDNPDFYLEDNVTGLENLSIVTKKCDSCVVHFKWSAQLRASLKRLAFSDVPLADYDFLKAPHNLTHFSIHSPWTVEEIDRLKKLAPKTTIGSTRCFPSNSMVTSKLKGEIHLDQLKIGDSIAGIQNGQVVYSQVTAIEYHFNIETDLIQLEQQTALASLSHQNHHSYKVQSTPNHPINSDLGIPTTVEKLNDDNLIYTLTGSSRLEDYKITHQPFSGTLINVRTSLGNYFIDGINFFNK